MALTRAQLIEEYAQSTSARERAGRESAEERAGHLERRCLQLRAESATLYDDFIRIEQDANATRVAKHMLDQRAADIARLQSQLAEKEAQVGHRANSCAGKQCTQMAEEVERRRAVDEHVALLRAEQRAAAGRCAAIEASETRLHAKVEALESQCAQLRQHAEQAEAEAGRWMSECTAVSRRCEQMLVHSAAEHAAQHVASADLRAAVEARDERIAQLEGALAEARLVSDSRALVGTGPKSIMSEIEELVSVQEGDSGLEDEQTAAFLTALLPRVAETTLRDPSQACTHSRPTPLTATVAPAVAAFQIRR